MKKLIDDVLKKLKKLSNDKKITSKLNSYLRVFIRLVNAYSSGKYTYVPWKTITLIVAGLIYFIYPIDLIPDFIPLSGLIDDIALIAWIYGSIEEDIDKFLEWEKIRLALENKSYLREGIDTLKKYDPSSFVLEWLENQ